MLLTHVRFSSQIYCIFFLRKISSIGQSRMERSMKQGKHLRWREIMAFICRWQGWWDHDSWGWGLHARQIASPTYCTPFVTSSSGAHLCSFWLTCSISRSDGLKKEDCLLREGLPCLGFSCRLKTLFSWQNSTISSQLIEKIQHDGYLHRLGWLLEYLPAYFSILDLCPLL